MSRLSATRALVVLALGVSAAQGACLSPAAPGEVVADVRGTWTLTAAQDAPSLQIAGSLVISVQNGDLITGSLSWEERDGTGVVRRDGGPVSGRVIERSDVDFDVLLPAGSRRHVARLVSDTMSGAWVQMGSGQRGGFRAVRIAAGGP